MDKANGAKANRERMESKGVKHAVASRERNEPFNGRMAVRFASGAGTAAWACRAVNTDGLPATIRRHAEGRGRRDLDIAGPRTGKSGKAARELDEGLRKPRTRKGAGRVCGRTGKLKNSTRAGKYFKVEVVPREDAPSKDAPSKDAPVKRERAEVPGSKAGCPGVSCIGRNRLGLETAEVLKLNFSPAGIEGVFKRLKSEPGFRPFLRSSERRTGARVYISCLARQFVNYIRRKLKAAGVNGSWATVGNRMETRKTAAPAAKANGTDANSPIETAATPNAAVRAYFKAMGMGSGPETRKVKPVPPAQAGRQARRRLVTGRARLPGPRGAGEAPPRLSGRPVRAAVLPRAVPGGCGGCFMERRRSRHCRGTGSRDDGRGVRDSIGGGRRTGSTPLTPGCDWRRF
ncbi:MAG: hypothetical protein LBQ12_04115 [Deltaproteobacteria bacterium]|jgi:hypothetical protein|nr:hypothetical protein [Deltaproteobacteria bacterium]